MAKKVSAIPVDACETFVSIRKTFSEGDVQLKLKALYQLQTIDSELDKIYQLRGELPVEVQALEDKLAELDAKVSTKLSQIEDANKKIADLQQLYKVSSDLVAKYKAQVDAGVQNSREFDSLSKEIEYQDLQSQIAIKKTDETKELIAQLNEDLESIKAKMQVKKDDLAAKKEELEQISASTEKQEEKLMAKRAESADKIDARTMSAYERIRASVKNRIAVAKFYYPEDDMKGSKDKADKACACGGCHSEIAPQRVIDISEGKKLVICEYCGRILVSPDIDKKEL